MLFGSLLERNPTDNRFNQTGSEGKSVIRKETGIQYKSDRGSILPIILKETIYSIGVFP